MGVFPGNFPGINGKNGLWCHNDVTLSDFDEMFRISFFSNIMALSKFEVQETIQSKVINDFRFGALL